MGSEMCIRDRNNISKMVIDFIMNCLIEDAEKRYGWEEVVKHPILNGEKLVEKLFEKMEIEKVDSNCSDEQKQFVELRKECSSRFGIAAE